MIFLYLKEKRKNTIEKYFRAARAFAVYINGVVAIKDMVIAYNNQKWFSENHDKSGISLGLFVLP